MPRAKNRASPGSVSSFSSPLEGAWAFPCTGGPTGVTLGGTSCAYWTERTALGRCPEPAGFVAGSSGRGSLERFGRSGSPGRDSRKMAARAERVWRSPHRERSRIASLVVVLVLAAGFGSAAGVAPPPTGTRSQASGIGTRGVGGGFSGAVAALGEHRGAGTSAASRSDATVPGVQAGPRGEAPSAIRAEAVVSQAVAPRPSATMHPVKVSRADAVGVTPPSVAVASLASPTPRTAKTVTIETVRLQLRRSP